MDSQLEESIRKGDMGFLTEALGSKDPCFFSSRFSSKDYGDAGNIFHLASDYGREEFVAIALEKLPVETVYFLLSYQERLLNNATPLHLAADKGHLGILKKMLDFHYIKIVLIDAAMGDSSRRIGSRPWFAEDFDGATPLHYALVQKREDCALLLLSVDEADLYGDMVDDHGYSPLSLALEQDCKLAASEIFRLDLNSKLKLSPNTMEDSYDGTGNVLHLAALNDRKDLVEEAIDKLSNMRIHHYLSQQEPSLNNMNPLHVAAEKGYFDIIKLMLDCYRPSCSSSDYLANLSPTPLPWLAVDSNGKIPLQYVLMPETEECALEILSMDMESLCDMVDTEGNSLLSIALERGLKQVALKNLTSHFSYRVVCADGLTSLHVIHQDCSELCGQLVGKHPELLKAKDKQGFTVLHTWLQNANLKPIDELLKDRQWTRDFIELMSKTDKKGNNPLHVIADSILPAEQRNEDEVIKAAQLLIDYYKEETRQEEASSATDINAPWLMRNKNNDTPLLLAIRKGREKLASFLMSVEIGSTAPVQDGDGALFLAVEKGRDDIVEEIVAIVDDEDGWSNFLCSKDGRNVLHLASNCSEEVAAKLVSKYPKLINKSYQDERTPLYEASIKGTGWLITLLLSEASPITNAPKACIEACKNGHLEAIKAFAQCKGFREACHDKGRDEEGRGLPHHIILGNYRDYQDFLAIPLIGEMKNDRDLEFATPLHRALERKDLHYVEALLTTAGVHQNYRDKNNKTASDLLVDLCKKDQKWVEMCQRVGIYARLKTMYLGTELDLDQARSTLSVVAGLLATLTFAAGFTLPGGLNSETGKAVLAKRASFRTFLLADGYAMCCSMLALFFLMWSMVSDEQATSVWLIDRSVLIVMQSLYGSLVAFAFGVYTVMAHKSLWPSIVISVMCSVVAIIATIMSISKTWHKFLVMVASAKEKINNKKKPPTSPELVISME